MTDDRQNSADIIDGHEDGDGRSRGLFGRLRRYLLAGIFVTAPIGITVYLTWLFLRFVNESVTALIPPEYNPFQHLRATVPGIELLQSLLSLMLVLVFFILVGWFARNILGRMLYRLTDYIVDRMPVIRNIYGAIKQIFETLMTSQSQAFKDVVLFQYPRPGIWTMGFVTGAAKGGIAAAAENGEELLSVFLPTAPSPTNGFLLFIPRKDLVYLDMGVEEGLKMVVTCGLITPSDPKAPDAVKTAAPAKNGKGKK